MQFRIRKRRKVIINITSLIDVMFMLMLFLLISTSFYKQQEQGIKLELPSAQTAAAVEEKDYVLFVDKESKMFLNDQQVGMENLENKIKEALPAMKNQTMVLKADQDISHGFVVKVMDVARRSGVKKLIIGTKSEK
jgi:biopolymer transport protein ExbD